MGSFYFVIEKKEVDSPKWKVGSWKCEDEVKGSMEDASHKFTKWSLYTIFAKTSNLHLKLYPQALKNLASTLLIDPLFSEPLVIPSARAQAGEMPNTWRQIEL